ncbi:MAG: carbohydrate-binding protein [Minicystis sp.]
MKLTSLLASALVIAATASEAFAADEVKLVAARSSNCPPVSGCYRDTYLRGTVEVKNLGYAKTIDLVYKDVYSGQWQSAPAAYVGPSSSGKELWSFDFSAAAAELAVSYTVNGQTYWDNNGGGNYVFTPYVLDAILTYPKIAEPVGERAPEQTSVNGRILVKNLSYTKVIRAVYTDDGWATAKEAYASYDYTVPSGVEAWFFSLPVAASAPSSAIEIAFEYTFDGGVDWDNNYGHNYRIVGGVIHR